MLLWTRKHSISVTAVSLLIKKDYSVIELYNVIIRKAVVFFYLKRPHKRDQPEWYRYKCKGSASTTHINFEDRNRKNLDHRFQSSSVCYVVITGGYFLLKQTEKINICLPKGVSTRHTSDFRRPCFASTTIAGKETSYSGLLSKWLVLMLYHHLTITNVQV